MTEIEKMNLETKTTIKTARERRAELTALGLSEDIVDAVVGAEAPLRHEARVRNTVDASNAEAQRLFSLDDHGKHAGGALLRFLDLVGTGGRLGLEGRTSARMPWAHGLGKGRFQASDGGAWKAALEKSLNIGDLRFARRGSSLEVQYESMHILSSHLGLDILEIPLDSKICPVPHELHFAMNTLRRLAAIWVHSDPETARRFRWLEIFNHWESAKVLAGLPFFGKDSE